MKKCNICGLTKKEHDDDVCEELWRESQIS